MENQEELYNVANSMLYLGNRVHLRLNLPSQYSLPGARLVKLVRAQNGLAHSAQLKSLPHFRPPRFKLDNWYF